VTPSPGDKRFGEQVRHDGVAKEETADKTLDRVIAELERARVREFHEYLDELLRQELRMRFLP